MQGAAMTCRASTVHRHLHSVGNGFRGLASTSGAIVCSETLDRTSACERTFVGE
jgi:hypothetical protein